MDWEEIKKDFILWRFDSESKMMQTMDIFNWFKNRIESAQIESPLSEEEKNELYTTNVTAEVNPKYNI